MNASSRRDGFAMVVGSLVAFGIGTARLDVKAASATGTKRSRTGRGSRQAVQLGECAGVAVDANGHVLIFHRPAEGSIRPRRRCSRTGRPRDRRRPGQLIASWGANMFLVPHGITVDGENNVFLTDVGLQQVFKFSHDGKPLLALGSARTGGWDGYAFQRTDRH